MRCPLNKSHKSKHINIILSPYWPLITNCLNKSKRIYGKGEYENCYNQLLFGIIWTLMHQVQNSIISNQNWQWRYCAEYNPEMLTLESGQTSIIITCKLPIQTVYAYSDLHIHTLLFDKLFIHDEKGNEFHYFIIIYAGLQLISHRWVILSLSYYMFVRYVNYSSIYEKRDWVSLFYCYSCRSPIEFNY